MVTKSWWRNATIAVGTLVAFMAIFWIRKDQVGDDPLTHSQNSYPSPLREYVFAEPISSRRVLLTTDPVWRYLMDRVGGTQVDVIFVDPAQWISDLEIAKSQHLVTHAWPKGNFILGRTEYDAVRKMDPDWPFDQPLIFDHELPLTFLTSFSLNFRAAQRWSDEFAQWMVGQDPVHQELFVLNADLLRVQLLALQSRWEKVLRFIKSVEGVTKDEANWLGFPGVGKAKEQGNLILEFVKTRNKESGDFICEVHLRSPQSGKIETLTLQLSKKDVLGKSWLKIWENHLSQLETAVKRLGN